MNDLDNLWDAVRHNTKVPAKGAKRETKEVPHAKALFMNPDNWRRTHGVALMHKETNSLLGNFSEYIHLIIPNCRKLVREEAPISVTAVEYAEGSWWIEPQKRPDPHQEWSERKSAIIHVYLPELKVHSPACEVVACLIYGGISRVELAVDTQFAQTEGADQLLELPAGTNILEVMGLDCKINLREELGL